MKQFRIIILLIATSMLLCACPDKEDGHGYINISNKSEKDIAFISSFNQNDDFFHCSDTGTTILITIPSDSFYLYKAPKDWKDLYWEKLLNKGQTMNIFVADGELYEEYLQQPCDTIRKYVPILHIYRLTLADLQRMNWTIVYPPEE
ncbi:MAG: hypothetical protein PHS30_00925 [Bacteroidales bacterium]|nr:hypothetical protein [Bacteroidales bacterium]